MTRHWPGLLRLLTIAAIIGAIYTAALCCNFSGSPRVSTLTNE